MIGLMGREGADVNQTGLRIQSDSIPPKNICGIVSHSGPHGEPLACGYTAGHYGPHAWSTLPTWQAVPPREFWIDGTEKTAATVPCATCRGDGCVGFAYPPPAGYRPCDTCSSRGWTAAPGAYPRPVPFPYGAAPRCTCGDTRGETIMYCPIHQRWPYE